MGKTAQLLLVIVCLLLSTLPATAAVRLSETQAEQVEASRYRAYWLWAAVRPQQVLHRAETLYLHQGEFARRQGKSVFLRQGLPPSRLKVRQLWLSFRFSTLDTPAAAAQQMFRLRQSWIDAGNPATGIQIDFDARSYQLAYYVRFLQQLRRMLPKECGLSITGLLDWAKTGDINTLNRLHAVVDELVVQTYQGRQTVPGYGDYLPALLHLRVPFRIGLVQQGHWDRRWEQRLAASRWYRGAVVFLVNPAHRRQTL